MIDKNRRIKRLYYKIKKMLNTYKYKCLFLTMSFNDDVLKNTNEKTRERYIKKYLKLETALYIVNRDYGKRKNREHYHAFIIASTLNKEDLTNDELKKLNNKINLKAYKYGNIKVDIIGKRYRPKNDKDFKITALNITNHFFKESTKNSRIITSRKPPTKINQLRRLNRLKETMKTQSEQDNINEILNEI